MADNINKIRYLLDRRKVIRRTLKTPGPMGLAGAFPAGVSSRGSRCWCFVCKNARSRTFNTAHGLRHAAGVRTVLFSQVFEYPYMKKAFDQIRFFFQLPGSGRENRPPGPQSPHYRGRWAPPSPLPRPRPCWTCPGAWPVLIDQFDSYWSNTHFAGMDVDTDPQCRHIKDEIRLKSFASPMPTGSSPAPGICPCSAAG